VIALAFPLMVQAQWVHYPTAGIPRTQDGKPNLTAPAPRTAAGTPDFSGMWAAATGKYLPDLGADGIEIPMQAWASALYKQRLDNLAKDRPSGNCLPHSVTDFDAHTTPRRLIQTQTVIAMLYEAYHSYRQIFIDARPLPEVFEPAWFGYSVGKWDRDTLVVNTTGINEKTWLDDNGHPHTEALRITERFRRPDFGHMQVELTIDDPKTYTKPWGLTIPWIFVADTELFDWVCENEKDSQHLVGK
jgi:hypothetical protein